MVLVIQAQQLHSYSTAYCQRSCSARCTPASTQPLHLHAQAAASNMLCSRHCTWLALHNAADYIVSNALVPLPTWTPILQSQHHMSIPTVRVMMVGLILALY